MLWWRPRKYRYHGAIPGVVAVASQAAAVVEPPPAELVEESSTKFAWDSGVLDPWDDTITIPAGSNRVLLDFAGLTAPGTYTDVLDPAGDNISLTEVTGSPTETTNENVVAHRLLEDSFPGTTGSKTLRLDWSSTHRGRRRVILLSGAAQTIHSAGNSAAGAVTVSVSHPTSSFAAGSRVYAAMYAQSTGTYAITGDAAEVDDEDVASDNDSWAFAAGTLASAQATASVTFTRDSGGTLRTRAIIAVVEPAA